MTTNKSVVTRHRGENSTSLNRKHPNNIASPIGYRTLLDEPDFMETDSLFFVFFPPARAKNVNCKKLKEKRTRLQSYILALAGCEDTIKISVLA